MFSFKQKENHQQPPSNYKSRISQYAKEVSRSQKSNKIALRRQSCTGAAIDCDNFTKFAHLIDQTSNYYSLFLTLFELTEDPLWRNRQNQICLIIQKLHNICATNYGDYLSELTAVQDYHGRLMNIFYLGSKAIQDHFRLLISIYLSYNSKYRFLQEEEVALGLIDASKTTGVSRIEYLWIVSQLRVSERAADKLLKLAAQTRGANSDLRSEALLPIVTTLANYIYHEQNLDNLELMMNDFNFQDVLLFGLSPQAIYDLRTETLLLCNNLLAKSSRLASKILTSQPLVDSASSFTSPEQSIFQTLLQLRRAQHSF